MTTPTDADRGQAEHLQTMWDKNDEDLLSITVKTNIATALATARTEGDDYRKGYAAGSDAMPWVCEAHPWIQFEVPHPDGDDPDCGGPWMELSGVEDAITAARANERKRAADMARENACDLVQLADRIEGGA